MKLGRLDDLFHQARELPAAQWDAFAARECTGEEELRRTVLAMLRQQGDAFAWFESAERSLGLFWEDSLPADIGPYRVLRELGRGGMGTVYLAERQGEGFQQTVAVKCMRREGAEVLQRFLSERRILSRLDHPGIARLLDGGRTEHGEPYFVMEYVAGERLGDWMRGTRTLREKLRLFRRVGEAVEYAHRNLVVHRDLKPANILMTADGQPKLLDFGIAKLLDDSQETGPGPLTPHYAAPEQLAGGAITTLTDVHGLGGLLHELLTGSHPPTGPLPTPAGVERELLQIAAKALQDRPEDRYQSVTAMLADLTSYETGQPVQAHGYGWMYRSSKYLRRHWVGVAFLALLLSAVGGLWRQTVQLERERQRARQVANLVPELFAGSYTAAVVERNLPALRQRFAGQPLLLAEILEAGGHACRNAGQRQSAARLFGEALRIRERDLGAEHPDVIETRRHQADAER